MSEHFAEVVRVLDDRLKAFRWTDPDTLEVIDASISSQMQWGSEEFTQPRGMYLRRTIIEPDTEPFYRLSKLRARVSGRYEVQGFRRRHDGEVAAIRLAGAISKHFYPSEGAVCYPDATAQFSVDLTQPPIVSLIPAKREGGRGHIAGSCQVIYESIEPVELV